MSLFNSVCTLPDYFFHPLAYAACTGRSKVLRNQRSATSLVLDKHRQLVVASPRLKNLTVEIGRIV